MSKNMVQIWSCSRIGHADAIELQWRWNRYWLGMYVCVHAWGEKWTESTERCISWPFGCLDDYFWGMVPIWLWLHDFECYMQPTAQTRTMKIYMRIWKHTHKSRCINFTCILHCVMVWDIIPSSLHNHGCLRSLAMEGACGAHLAHRSPRPERQVGSCKQWKGEQLCGSVCWQWCD